MSNYTSNPVLTSQQAADLKVALFGAHNTSKTAVQAMRRIHAASTPILEEA